MPNILKSLKSYQLESYKRCFAVEYMLVKESGQNQNCNFPILTVRVGRRIRKTQAKIETAIPILDRFRSDSDALVLEHQIRLVSDSETMIQM